MKMCHIVIYCMNDTVDFTPYRLHKHILMIIHYLFYEYKKNYNLIFYYN